MTESFTQTTTFEAPREAVFEAIADPARHSEVTGAPAELSRDAGDRFTTHGGAIEGWTLDIEPGERIVQAWRPADWDAGVYSVVRYDFADEGDGTRITLTHSAVPDGAAPHLEAGWQSMYWEPLAAYLAR